MSAIQAIAENLPYGVDLGVPAANSMSNMASLSEVLNYLEADDGAGFTTINLPSTRSFSFQGEPTIIKVSNTARGRGSPKK
jgi:hypothetical protein